MIRIYLFFQMDTFLGEAEEKTGISKCQKKITNIVVLPAVGDYTNIETYTVCFLITFILFY